MSAPKTIDEGMEFIDAILAAQPPSPESMELIKRILNHDGPIVMVSSKQFKKLKKSQKRK